MLRRSIPLFIALSFVAVCASVIVWSSRETARLEESLRMSRSRHQLLEQQVSLVRSPGMQQRLAALEEDLDTLRIRLVEVLTQQARPVGVLSVDFEQLLLPALASDGEIGPVSVLRLELRLIVQHAIGFLEMLEQIDMGVAAWPHETQACRVQRIPEQRLQVECALDFYHWAAGRQQVSTRPDGQGTRTGLVI